MAQLLMTFVPSLTVVAAMAAAGVLFEVNMDVMTRDVAATANLHPLTGVLSNLGVVLWGAAASISAFAAMTLRHARPRKTFWFLLCSALLSAYLLLDDFFLFHDELAPRYLGVDEKLVYAALGIAVCAYLIAFRRVILQTYFAVLLLALGFLGMAVVMDALLEPWLRHLGHWEYFVEDGAKWLGIACWCSYYVRTSHQLVVGHQRAAGP